LAWGAAWLYRATGDKKYLQKAEQFASSLPQTTGEFSWDNKVNGVKALLWMENPGKYQADVDKMVNDFLNKGKTRGGLLFIQKWGALRHAANVAHLLLQVAEAGHPKAKALKDFAKGQINYMLGANPQKRSYVVGVEPNPPVAPHHRGASCPKNNSKNGCLKSGSQASPHVLYGALVGGPDGNDNYNDDRGDYIKNEVAVDYNAGFQSALAALAEANK